jgi:hypothetical protein
MQPEALTDADTIFAAVHTTIDDTLGEVLERTRGRTGLLAATLGLALDRIGAAT